MSYIHSQQINNNTGGTDAAGGHFNQRGDTVHEHEL